MPLTGRAQIIAHLQVIIPGNRSEGLGVIREGGKTHKDVSLGWLLLQKPGTPIRRELLESHKMTQNCQLRDSREFTHPVARGGPSVTNSPALLVCAYLSSHQISRVVPFLSDREAK